MSTIRPPKKDKAISSNWICIQGERDELPESFNFHDQKKLRTKQQQGYEAHYIYKNKDGLTNFVVERKFGPTKAHPEGQKQFLLHSKWENKINNQKRWMARKYPEPRPIFNLDKLERAKTSKLLIVEGEKACTSYKQPRPITTWACGTYCVLKNDWSPVSSFTDICLIPDNDAKGREAMHRLAMHLHEEQDVSMDKIYWVSIPKDFPEGWDIADPIPKSFNGDADTLINNAKFYDEEVEDYKSIWNEFKMSKVKKEVHKDREIRLRELGDDCIYIEELNEILHLPTDRLVPLPHFNNNYAYLKIGQRTPSAFLTSQEPEVFKRANAFCYNPKYKSGLVEIDGIKYANRYKAPSIIMESGDISHWEEQGCYMFGPDDWDIVEQYFAWIIQNLGEKAMWSMLWISEQRGIGKGWLSNMITQMIGIKNCRPNLKYKNVIGRFSDWVIGCQFAVINEVFIQNRHDKKMEMSEEIKDFITEPTVHLEQKFRRPFDYMNTCNLLLISNFLNCMYINNLERRYWIKNLVVQELGVDYWVKKWEWLNSGKGPRIVLHHLKNLKIKDPKLYKFRAPITSDFDEMAKQSEHPIFRWLDEHFEAETGPFNRRSWYRNFNFMYSRVDLHRTCENFHQTCSMDVVQDWLKRNCFKWQNNELTKQIELSDGTRPRVYMIPPREPKSAKDYWVKQLHAKTDKGLGILYEEKTGERPATKTFHTNSNEYEKAKQGE